MDFRNSVGVLLERDLDRDRAIFFLAIEVGQRDALSGWKAVAQYKVDRSQDVGLACVVRTDQGHNVARIQLDVLAGPIVFDANPMNQHRARLPLQDESRQWPRFCPAGR